jgi:putative spermidine/putrescine transport system substrate-binding protein
MEKLLEQKEVAVAVLHDGAAWDLAKRGLPIEWVAPREGVPILDQVAHVTRGSKQKDLAWRFLDAYLSPEVQLAYATELFFSPTNRTVKPPAEVARKIISGPRDVDQLVIFDWRPIVDRRPGWTERWNKEVR